MFHQIDFQRISHFLAVAECLNFTEAANRLYMSQSSLSKSVASLEASIGFPLFFRSSRKVRLTPEGNFLYHEFTKLISTTDKIIEYAIEMHNGTTGCFSIGAAGFLPSNPFFQQINSSFSKEYPSFEIQLHFMQYNELRNSLMDSRIDAALFNQYGIAGLHGFYVLPIMKGEPILVYNKNFTPPQSDKALSVNDFKNEKFVCVSQDTAPNYYGYLISCCNAYNFTPNIVKFTSSLLEAVQYVSNVNYVTILDRSLFPLINSDIELLHIPHIEGMKPCIGTVLVWRDDNQNPALQKYVSFAEDLMKTRAELI